ncbi:MAG: transglutaminase-like domain-containing protein [Lachnospiraceae bacterium]|nr:transglutaminase-like domain-containing protein [Lachnospiraceae bacterium]MCM1238326.1 transglutaminase-like domain-containing protein [Lachnospiraceae bacterium]
MNDFRFEYIECLSVELPEDILKRKWHGDFQGADRLIGLWLERDIPGALRKKLILEREILKRLPGEYPYTYAEALAKLREAVPDLTEEEFRALQDQGRIDWIYVDGEERFFGRFVETLLKVDFSLTERADRAREASACADRPHADRAEADRPRMGRVEADRPHAGKAEEDKTRTGRKSADSALAAASRERSSQQPADREKQALLDVVRQIREQGSAECRFHIRASLRIRDESFQKGRVKVHIPIPAECAQLRDIRILAAFPEPYELAPPHSPQRAVCFQENMRENHEFWVEYSYVNRADYVEMDPDEVQPIDPAEFAADLAEQLPHIRFTPYMRTLAGKLTEGLENPLDRARSIYDYITAHVEYSFVRSYLTIENLAEYAAIGGRGDCGIQALMFITLCRIAGVPARWQSGLYTTPFSAGCHDWAQVYIAPYGWRCVDCSFGGSAHREGNEEGRRFYFGNLDPFRMAANSRFQCEFDVKKNFLRADPYDNQRGEAEYEDRGLGFEDMVWKAEIE